MPTRKNHPHRKERRREAAKARAAYRATLSPSEQIEILTKRCGRYPAASRERVRLVGRIIESKDIQALFEFLFPQRQKGKRAS